MSTREVQFIGELPHDGAWVMHAVPTSGAKWAIVVADSLGKHEPRVIKDGVMSVLKPVYGLEDARMRTIPIIGDPT